MKTTKEIAKRARSLLRFTTSRARSATLMSAKATKQPGRVIPVKVIAGPQYSDAELRQLTKALEKDFEARVQRGPATQAEMDAWPTF